MLAEGQLRFSEKREHMGHVCLYITGMQAARIICRMIGLSSGLSVNAYIATLNSGLVLVARH